MKLWKGILALTILFAFAATLAEADGKKINGKFRIRNKVGGTAGVIIDPSQSIYSTLQEFLADGGRFLDAGQKAEFDVKTGSHRILTVTAETGDLDAFQNISIAANQTRCFCMLNNTDGTSLSFRIEEENCNNNQQNQ